MKNESIKKISDLLNQKLNLLCQYRDISKAYDKIDVESLAVFLTNREPIINEIIKINNEIKLISQVLEPDVKEKMLAVLAFEKIAVDENDEIYPIYLTCNSIYNTLLDSMKIEDNIKQSVTIYREKLVSQIAEINKSSKILEYNNNIKRTIGVYLDERK